MKTKNTNVSLWRAGCVTTIACVPLVGNCARRAQRVIESLNIMDPTCRGLIWRTNSRRVERFQSIFERRNQCILKGFNCFDADYWVNVLRLSILLRNTWLDKRTRKEKSGFNLNRRKFCCFFLLPPPPSGF